MKSLFAAGAILASVCCGAGNSPAKDATWTGMGTDAKWETAANWADSQAPVDGDAIVFSGTIGTNSRNGTPNLTLSGITFSADAGAFSVNGKPIKLRGDIANLGSNPQTLNLHITLMKNVVITTNGDLSMGGAIRSERLGIDKTGAASLTLTGFSTFKGPTVVHAGTLVLAANQALGTSSTVELAGGQLALGNNVSPAMGALKVASAAILDFGSGSGSHAVTFANSKAQPWTGTLSIYNWDGDATVSNSLGFGTDNTGLTPAQLKAITFYRDSGKMLLGNGAWASNNGQLTFARGSAQ